MFLTIKCTRNAHENAKNPVIHIMDDQIDVTEKEGKKSPPCRYVYVQSSVGGDA